MSRFNPFDHLFAKESNKYIHARTLRTSFWEKISDTFFVFAGTGKSTSFNGQWHAGLFDYLTLSIPLFMNWLIAKRSESGFFPFELSLVFLVALVFDAVRYCLAAIFTLIVSPIVLLVHAVSSVAGYSLKESAHQFPVNSIITSAYSSCYGANTTLGRLLADNDLNLEDIEVSYDEPCNRMNFFKLTISKKNGESIKGQYTYYALVNEKSVNTNKASFDALLKLNIGGFAGLFHAIPHESFKSKFPEENETSFNLNNNL